MVRLVLLILVLLLALAAPAFGQSTQLRGSVGDAVDDFKAGDPVYVDPDARDRVPRSEEQRLEEEIRTGGGRIYLAVLPSSAGTASEVGRQIIGATRQDGTYGWVVGNRFEAASSDLSQGEAGRLAAQAVRGNSVSRGLAEFVTTVNLTRSSSGATGQSGGGNESGGGNPPSGGSESGGASFLPILGIAALAFGVFALIKGRRRQREQQEDIADLRRVATDDLVALGGDIRALDLDVEMPGASPEAKQRYGEAVEAYTRAEAALERARSSKDFEPIGKELEEGRYDIAAARALLQGEQPPERRAPCFFDPRHGPSVADVEWAPADGEPRPVPVCAADAVRLQEGEEPMSREIELGGRRMPYWQAPGQFAPFYAGGMFGGFGGLATGLLFGSMLGGAMYGGWGAEDAHADAGGFGGGDFGGGDFGGGGFGGGDFGGGGGGGDFGGGDFG
jgi:hypothetical protein